MRLFDHGSVAAGKSRPDGPGAILIAYARANRGELTSATPGNGTTPHLTPKIFQMMGEGCSSSTCPVAARRRRCRAWSPAIATVKG
jgi:hypothetical protein